MVCLLPLHGLIFFVKPHSPLTAYLIFSPDYGINPYVPAGDGNSPGKYGENIFVLSNQKHKIIILARSATMYFRPFSRLY